MKNKLHLNTPQKLWQGRTSENIQYWHQAVTCLQDLDINRQDERKIALLGYAGDEGVRRNLGRPGAGEGPNAIRKMMASMAFHLPSNLEILDYGDVVTLNQNMEASHDLIMDTVSGLLKNNQFPVLLGGGHDLAFAHAKGILNHLKTKHEMLGIINLDAHFDLRPLTSGMGHSGSPFFQLAKDAKAEKIPFHYFCLGIQHASNPSELFKTAQENGVWWLEMGDFKLSNWENIQNHLSGFLDKVNKVYFSIDLDGFSSAYAPGVSAPSPMGFSPELAFKVLEFLAKSKKLISMDVVELNPKFDQDNVTAKLASRCIEFVARKMFEEKSS